VWATPGAYAPLPDGLADLAGQDLAVLELAEPLADVASWRVAEPVAGEKLRALGFGRIGDDEPGSGERRAAEVTVTGRAGSLLATTAAACAGDSGGGLFDADGQLVAVISSKVGSCTDGELQASLLGALDGAGDAPPATAMTEPSGCAAARGHDGAWLVLGLLLSSRRARALAEVH
jgi:hypothetical protein